MEKIANRLLLKTNTEYIVNRTDRFFITIENEKAVICSDSISPNGWYYIFDNIENVINLGSIAINEDPDYYPDGYLNIDESDQYFIDDNDVLMIKGMWELEDSEVSDWINENSEEITVFNQSVVIDSDMCESMGIFDEISNAFYFECLDNEHPDIIEFFDYDDHKVTEWLESHNQTPKTILIDENGDYIESDNELMVKIELITESVFTMMMKKPELNTNTFYDIFNKVFEILND